MLLLEFLLNSLRFCSPKFLEGANNSLESQRDVGGDVILNDLVPMLPQTPIKEQNEDSTRATSWEDPKFGLLVLFLQI